MSNIQNFAGIRGLSIVHIRAPKARNKWGVVYKNDDGVLYRVPRTFWTEDDAKEYALAQVKEAGL